MRSLGAQRQRSIGHVLAIEVTLADRVEDDDRIDAAVIYVGEHAYRRRDGIVTAPFALLGP